MSTSQRQLGLRLRRLRERHGLTQAELARRLALSPSYLNQIERNQRPLTLAVQQRLRDTLGDLGDLLDRDDPAALVEPLGETMRALGHGGVGPTELRALAGSLPQGIDIEGLPVTSIGEVEATISKARTMTSSSGAPFSGSLVAVQGRVGQSSRS